MVVIEDDVAYLFLQAISLAHHEEGNHTEFFGNSLTLILIAALENFLSLLYGIEAKGIANHFRNRNLGDVNKDLGLFEFDVYFADFKEKMAFQFCEIFASNLWEELRIRFIIRILINSKFESMN